MPLLPLTSGNWDTFITKVADETVSSTTIQNDDDFFFTTVAGAIYEFVLVMCVVASSTSPDIKIAMGENTNTKNGGAYTAAQTTTGGGTGTALENRKASISLGAIATPYTIFVDGCILGFGGTWNFQWACNAAGGTTTVKAGSFLRYRRKF